ncbi:Endoglucanase [Diplonema papillatum]|nr:Endoglucanase [Diplonema papillatum]
MLRTVAFLACALLGASVITPPLRVNGTKIYDANDNVVKPACVNWYGAEELDYIVGGLQWNTIDNIVAFMAEWNFNCVRIPFSLEVVDRNPPITNATIVAMEPQFYGQDSMALMDKVIGALSKKGIMTILDNHNSDASWCCDGSDGNGLWWTASYPTEQWMTLWEKIVKRYSAEPMVIGLDLRNELRSTTIDGKSYSPTWGDNDNNTDWRLAAVNVIKRIQAVNPDLLMFVEGINYALDLTGVAKYPILDSDVLVPHKILYSSHAYSWSYGTSDPVALPKILNERWGYIMENVSAPYAAPVWVGEFGVCHTNSSSCVQSEFWTTLQKYLRDGGMPFSWWAIDGTMSRAPGREYGGEETFGLLNTTWSGPANTLLISQLQSLMSN